MSVGDVFGDCLARIRNAQMARLLYVEVIRSGTVLAFCNIMKDEGYILDFNKTDCGRLVAVRLRYSDCGVPAIRAMRRISKPGCRVYVPSKRVAMLYRGLGLQILSTPEGVMPAYVAKERNLGGEVLCNVF